jgi:hypothetical protein
MNAVGGRLVAGWRGTAAMTVSSTAEAKLSGRGPSTTPAVAAGKIAGVVLRDEAGERRFNTLAHWRYGTPWGLFRGAPDLYAKSTPYYGMKVVGTDTFHHAVCTGVSGLVYDYLGNCDYKMLTVATLVEG